jgi:hypothetical protein
MTDRWDAFLSYASEDRTEFAEPLYRLLTDFGLRIWFDKSELEVGDSLRQRIDAGLAQSRYGIVVLSPSFFEKHYPQRELNGLAQREVNGEKVILPVWHGLEVADVRRHSPPLADRIAANSKDGVEAVAAGLIIVLRPDLLEESKTAAKTIRNLPELRTGRQLFDLLADAHACQLYDDEVISEEEAEIIGGFKTSISEIGDFAEDLDHTEQLRWQLNLTKEIEQLNAGGWRIFGERRRRRIKDETGEAELDMAVVAILRQARKAATLAGGKLIVAREPDQSAPLKS